jgi:hypothetical protein
MIAPVEVKRDPWQGQSQDVSASFHFRVQPRCVQLIVTAWMFPLGERYAPTV